jgi:hypothetical protein
MQQKGPRERAFFAASAKGPRQRAFFHFVTTDPGHNLAQP